MPGAVCTICAEDIADGEAAGTQLDCGHSFHVGCIVRWFRYEHTTCPNCRSDDATHAWTRCAASARISALRRKYASLPRDVRNMLDRLDRYASERGAMRRDLTSLRTVHKDIFAKERRLSSRWRQYEHKHSTLRRQIARVSAAGVPHMVYHGRLDEMLAGLSDGE